MPEIARGIVPAGKRLLPLILLIAAGGPQSPRPPMIDLPPGKYQYALKIAGGPARNNQIEIGAGDTWGVMIGPGGDVLPLQMY